MGIFTKIFGGADGCRESMRDSYVQHVKIAKKNGMDSPHEIGLFGALSSRYRSRGLPVNEAIIWAELVPFIAMERSIAIEAIAEYAVFQENPMDAREDWLWAQINNALYTTSDRSLLEMANIGILNEVTWSGRLYPEISSAVILGEPCSG